MGIGNKKILSEVRKVRQVSSFRNSLLRFPARGKSQPSVISDYSDYYAFQVLFHLLLKGP